MNKINYLLITFLIITLSHLLICSSALAQQIKVPPKKKTDTTEKGAASTNPKPVYGSIKDSRDGKTYKTVKINSQTWMAENLAYKASSGCWAYDDNENNVAKYGYLYKWETAKKICPTGWHLPTDAEWTTLITDLGGKDAASPKMKSTGGWKEKGNGTNTSGFAGLPGGYRGFNETFYYIGSYGDWWSLTEAKAGGAWDRSLDYFAAKVGRDTSNKQSGLSVRCLKNL